MKVTILGAGSFGTSLAKLLAENKHDVLLWSHSEDTARSINEKNENIRYLPGFKLPSNIKAASDLEAIFASPELILCVVPTQVIREVLNQCKRLFNQKTPIVICSKGIEIETNQLVCDIFLDVLGEEFKKQLFFLSGPSFAKEIVQQIPTAVTMAGYDQEKIADIQGAFRSSYFKIYGTNDVIGVELGGALKNVIAIACGISEGLGMGSNSQATLITRGLTEVARLGQSMGARHVTFMGLAGMGDLVLTCTGDLSRNRTLGIRIGEGMSLKSILANMNQVAEGVPTTKSAYEVSKAKQVNTPIIDGVYQILYENKSPHDILSGFMKRDYKLEAE